MRRYDLNMILFLIYKMKIKRFDHKSTNIVSAYNFDDFEDFVDTIAINVII